jgi:hypothetical protein
LLLDPVVERACNPFSLPPQQLSSFSLGQALVQFLELSDHPALAFVQPSVAHSNRHLSGEGGQEALVLGAAATGLLATPIMPMTSPRSRHMR